MSGEDFPATNDRSATASRLPALAGIVSGLALSGWQIAGNYEALSDHWPGWIAAGSALDATPFLLWLIPALFLCFFSRAEASSPLRRRSSQTSDGVLCFLVCSAAGFAAAAGLGWRVHDLPPLYHDEYSYLFQAKTFLAGRFFFPAPAEPDCFAQMHVLTENLYASRFFPGTGLWLAPFVGAGAPIVASWTAAGLTAGFLALAGRRFSTAAGWTAGLWSAVSPAIIAFDNQLLSTGPTMLWMSLFLWSYLSINTSSRSGKVAWSLLAGAAIGMALLTRPLTAFGLGAPFAMHALGKLLPAKSSGDRIVVWAMIAGFFPFAFGLLAYNAALTGSPLRSPYGVYLDRYTPTHQYGFYNVSRAKIRPQHQSVHKTDLESAYDRWAEEATDLTPAIALRQTFHRLRRLAAYSVGVYPMAILGVMALCLLARLGDRLLLLMLGVVGLAVVYAPYWFEGILGFSYVAEATPFVLLIVSAAAGEAMNAPRHVPARWWTLLVPLNAAVLFASDAGLYAPGSELVHPRRESAVQRKTEERLAAQGPILVVVEADPRDSIHSTWVHNEPALDGPVVRIWSKPGFDKVLAEFPDRTVYRWRPATKMTPESWTRLRPPVH